MTRNVLMACSVRILSGAPGDQLLYRISDHKPRCEGHRYASLDQVISGTARFVATVLKLSCKFVRLAVCTPETLLIRLVYKSSGGQDDNCFHRHLGGWLHSYWGHAGAERIRCICMRGAEQPRLMSKFPGAVGQQVQAATVELSELPCVSR